MSLFSRDSAEMSNITNHTAATFPLSFRITLVFLYVLVFIGGIMGVILMSTILKSNILSVTTVSVINLMVVHVVFLLTVPFRIYYYTSTHWDLGPIFCKLNSGMLHAHMYLSFIFYTIILSTRYLAYFEWRQRLEFYRVLHALMASLTIWVIILGSALPATVLNYGTGMRDENVCFSFGHAVQKSGVKVLNYVISAMVLLIWTGLASCQLYILWNVCRKHKETSFSHQEFWVQIKSLFFVLIMLFCFVPYQSFRIYYVSVYGQELENINEVFLAITAFSCFDMLIFAGRDMWQPVFRKCCVLSASKT